MIAAALIMAAGWGIRGSFGHSRGAMLPGAMLGLTLAACAMRGDWWKRAALLGFLAAIGWGFGGTSSYGLLIGYSMGGSFLNSLYGYSALFIVGALYCGIGAGFLALGLTAKRSLLESAVVPMLALYTTWLLLDLSGATGWGLGLFAKDPEQPTQTAWLYDTLWLQAIVATVIGGLFYALTTRYRTVGGLLAAMGCGWLLAMWLLVGLTGFRINPSRGDAWAGCIGIQAALILHFWRQQNRAALMLTGYGLLAGGYGFAVGDFIQALGRGKWGPIGAYPVLQEFGYWTLMEQFFGGVMGAGMALAILRLRNGKLQTAEEDVPPGGFNYLAAFVLLGMLFVFNSQTNISGWLKSGQVPEVIVGLSTRGLLIGLEVIALLLLAYALWQVYRGRLPCYPAADLPRAQALALLVIGLVLCLYLMLPGNALPTSLMIYGSLIIGAAIIVSTTSGTAAHFAASAEAASGAGETVSAAAPAWQLGWRHGLLWGLVPVCLMAQAWLTMQLEIPVRQFRFTNLEATSQRGP